MTDQHSSEQTGTNGEQIGPMQPREFTGVWIPAFIVLDEDLNWSDRAAYAEIACYESCFMSNAFFARRLGLSIDRARKIISKLKDKGYIEQVSFDGRKRYLQVIHNYGRKQPGSPAASMQHGHDQPLSMVVNDQADRSKTTTIDNNLDNNLDNTYFEGEKPSTLRLALIDAIGYASAADYSQNEKALLRNALDEGERRLASLGATPSEIQLRSARYRQRFTYPLTPMALAKHWPRLDSGVKDTKAPYESQQEYWELDDNGDAKRISEALKASGDK